MTLTISIVTPRTIYQCADFRLLHWGSNQLFDFDTQKVVLASARDWTATICFAGVGRTPTVDVSTWLAERIATLDDDGTFDTLLAELAAANVWLGPLPADRRRHSFSVGAFVQGKPTFALVSNFEALDGSRRNTASSGLTIERRSVVKPFLFLSGQTDAVLPFERKQLVRVAQKRKEVREVYDLMGRVNRLAANRSRLVSPNCFMTHVNLTGKAGGQLYGDQGATRHAVSVFTGGPSGQLYGDQGATRHAVSVFTGDPSLTNHLEKAGFSGGTLKQVVHVRSAETRQEHELRIREEPHNPVYLSNFGAFLIDREGDAPAAERAYRRALEIDPAYASAMGNLANLLWKTGRLNEAAVLYRRSIDLKPRSPLRAENYARFLWAEQKDAPAALRVVDEAITKHPEYTSLRLLRARLYHALGRPSDAVVEARVARDSGNHVLPSRVQPGRGAGRSSSH